MKNIPCIDSDFPLWDWENPINNTIYQSELLSAYDAITSQGLTYNFGIRVWKCMVEWVRKAYKEGGLTWDDKYGDINSVIIKSTTDDGILTAKRWNALTYNISKQIGTVWKWEYDKTQSGYIGRSLVEKNDFLYGWYMLELFEGINRLVGIMRGSANTSDCEYRKSIESNINASLVAPKAGILSYRNSIKGNISSDVYAGKAGILTGNIKELTNVRAEAKSLLSNRMFSRNHAHSYEYADFISFYAPKLKSEEKSKTSIYADFYANVYVGRMFVNQIIKSSIYADLMPGIPFYPKAYAKERSKTMAVLTQQKPYLFGAGVTGKAKEYGAIHLADVNHLTAHTGFKSAEEAVITLMHILGFASGAINRTTYSAKLVAPRSALLYFMDGSFSEYNADMASLPVERIEAKAKEKSIYDAVVTDLPSMPVTAFSNSESSVNAEAVSIRPVYASGSSKSADSTYGGLISSNPRLMNGTAKEKSSVLAEPVTLQSRIIQHRKSSTSKARAEMRRGLATQVESKSKIISISYADLTFYKEPGAWRDPEQRGKNLRIWNAHPQWREGTNVHLDSGGVYYDPEQTGSNVYIRSTDSMKGDGIDG